MGNAVATFFAHEFFFRRVVVSKPMGVKPWGLRIGVFAVLLLHEVKTEKTTVWGGPYYILILLFVDVSSCCYFLSMYGVLED